MSAGNPRFRMWLMLALLIGVIVGAMYALMLLGVQEMEDAKLTGSVGEPRNGFVVDELDRTPSVSRDHERDPLSAALDYSEHMATFEPPTPTPTPTPTAVVPQPRVVTASGDPTAEQWADLRQCESGGNYATNTGNGYSGAYQFLDSTWQAYGGTGSAYQASPAEQDMRALMLYHASGPGPWPVCGQYLY